jgi:hypothetical protein
MAYARIEATPAERSTMAQSRPPSDTHRRRWQARLVLVAVTTAVLAVMMITVSPAGPPGHAVAPSRPTTTTTTPPGTDTPLPIEDAVELADGRAALVQLCLAALDDPAANAYYHRARAAHPTIADGIGPDCRLAIRPAGRTGIAIG